MNEANRYLKTHKGKRILEELNIIAFDLQDGNNIDDKERETAKYRANAEQFDATNSEAQRTVF